MQMLKAFLPGTQEETSSSLQSGKVDAKMEMDDPEKAMATVAQLIEQLHAKTSSPQDKELTTARLLGIAKGKREARRLIGSYGQAMPLFISMLRNGTSLAKVNVASILCVLCKDKELRLKVLLGGCIPPLLSVLKSGTIETRKAAAEAIYEVSSAGISSDHIGMKIFITEGVVPTLWDQLSLKGNQDKVVEGYVTGALRNLCGVDDGYWRLTLEVISFCDSIQKILNSGVVKSLIQLLEQKNDINVRASAADALEALSSKSDEAKKCVKDAGGVHALIEAIVAPSKECMQGKHGQSLQEHATGALANVFGGMRHLIIYLGEVSQSPRLTEPIGDVIGALAYALMIFKQPESSENIFDPSVIESILVKLLKPRDTKLIQERILEAMASLYGNSSLSCYLDDAEAKRVLIALITMASADVRERLIICLSGLCHDKVGIWEAIGKREGIQLFISFLGLSSEQHQEYAVEMLKILTAQVDDSKWAVTAAGGIPPLVQLLETGSQKAKEDAACILWNLCCHSEEIRDCVERAGGIPAFLWLLKTGGPNSQETSAKTLVKLVHTADPATINQLLALLLGDDTTSKIHVIKVLGHVLSKASQEDLVHRGCAANKGLRSLVESLTSSREETKEHTASVLADLFSSRQDICGHLATDDIIHPWIKLLTNNTQNVAKQVARALDALSRPVKKNNNKKKSYIAEGDIKSLITLAKNSSIESAENAVSALANLLSDPDIAAEALAEDVVSAFTRILADGSPEGKRNASRALHQLLKNFPVCDVLKGSAQCRFAILSLVDSLKSIAVDSPDAFNILEVVALLVKTKSGVNFSYPPWIALAEVPSSLETLVQCLTEGHTLVQDKAIEVLSRLCSDQQFLLSELIVSRPKSMGVLADRIVNASSLEVRVGGTALLLCAAKEKKQLITETLDQSGFSKLLLHALIDMIKHNSTCFSLETEVQTPKVALWLLCILTSVDAKSKVIVMEAGGLEVLLGKLARYTSSPQAEFEDTEGIWISALLLAIMFQDDNVSFSSTTMRIIPTLAVLLGSDELIDRYFAAHAMASLVCTRNRGINLTIANSGAVSGIINLVGYLESEILNLDALANEFSLVKEPDQVILQHLFEIEDVRLGCTARKSIPLLVDLLRPIPDRPGAPQFAVQILIRIADGNSTEYAISELLRILFSNHELRQNEIGTSSVKSAYRSTAARFRSARYSAAGALNELFDAETSENSEIACQAVQPLMDILGTVSESEQESTTQVDMVEAGIIERCLELLPGASKSSSQAIQQLGAELLSHFLTMEDFQQDITTQSAVVPLVRLAGIGILSLQETAIKALEKISASWPKAVLDAGGIFELSKVILQEDPQPPLDLWESAAFVLSNIVQYDAEMLFQKRCFKHSGKWLSLAAIDALLDLLRSHQCEEESGSLLETRSEPGRLLAALALGDLSQHEGLSRSSEVSGQAALMVNFCFPNHTLQEYVSNELIRSLTAALERGLWSTATINIEVLRTLNVIFSNFPKLRASEAATFCIPHLVGALKSGVEDVQGLVLDILYLLRHSWTNMSIDVAKSQAMIAAEAIPVLQMLMKTCPPRFHDKADSLLHCLPGCLTVNVMRANNLKQSMATTNAFCQLTIGNCPPRQTKVVSNSTTPEWKEGFTWAFDVPPKGQSSTSYARAKAHLERRL
ncbi:unnamed protein product [Arabidopsis arenosa]|uniref:C2 domain-containing protein n=1 Tax=Arabidopsis arenosa TaxID=38785 RepID=A0A8S1ZQN7_ARAAE|nr:unnamed protein product [Arabidopsis arenosa]